jgi:hypothetical protein
MFTNKTNKIIIIIIFIISIIAIMLAIMNYKYIYNFINTNIISKFKKKIPTTIATENFCPSCGDNC